MLSDLAAPADGALGSAAAPAASLRPRRAWGAWAGGLMTAALLAGLLLQLGGTSAQIAATLLGLSPAVWIAFALLYLAQPLADLVIFRSLWRLPASGLSAMLCKTVLNETVLGYSGEGYLYLWARRKAGLAAAPFEAIKDVTILSALTGNAATCVLLVLGAGRLHDLDLAHRLGPALGPGLAVAAAPFALALLAPRMFSLPPPRLAFVAGVHLIRLAVTSGLTLLAWRLALPQVALGDWVAVLALRMLAARLPFVTNKDLVFGNLMLLLAGPHAPVALLMAALAVATLLAHLAAIGLVGLQPLLARVRRRR
jgi:hypothetical protein